MLYTYTWEAWASLESFTSTAKLVKRGMGRSSNRHLTPNQNNQANKRPGIDAAIPAGMPYSIQAAKEIFANISCISGKDPLVYL